MKTTVFFCISAIFIQSALSQFAGRIGPGIGPYGPLGYDIPPYLGGCGVGSTGGGLPVTSASPFPPIGVTVVSENTYEGALTVGGILPFLATVALEGILPSVGSGTVSYGCGNGAIGIDEGPLGPAGGLGGYPLGPYGPGYGPGYGPSYGPGCGLY